MASADDHARRARRTWSGGNWDSCARLVAPVGPVVLDRIGIEPGQELLDVGTGNGSSIAIPAAQRGARVVASDVTPELFATGRRRAAEESVEIEWVEADAQDLPFADGRFDRVTSTFGAMFAPDHGRAAAELVRVCRPGGRIGMTTWATEGFFGGVFTLTGTFAPPPRPGAGTPPEWGSDDHVRAMFGAAGVEVGIAREQVDFTFASEADALDRYVNDFGPFVALRRIIEPQGRWDEFVDRFAALVARYARPDGDGIAVVGDYLLITAER
jgi:SAM-dependent methyltransferase